MFRPMRLSWITLSMSALAMGCFAAGTTGLASSQGGKLTPIKATIIAPGANYAQLSIAKQRGLFAKNGLDVEFIVVDTANSGIASAISGATQFAFTGPNIVDAVASGIPIVAIYSFDNVSVAQVCALTSIKSVKDLAGKVVGVPNRGSAPDVTFRIWLESQGLGESQLTIRNINAGTPAVMAAAAAGQIQAFSLNPPRCYLNAQAGFHVLADLGSTGMPYFNAGMAVSRDYLKKNRETVRAFVAALMEAKALFKKDRAIAFEAIKDQDKVKDPEVAAQVWEFYKKYWADPPTVSQDAMLQAIKYSSAEKTRSNGPSIVTQMFDNSVIESIVKK